MSEVVTLLGTGSGQSQDRTVRIEVLPITPETALDQIEELLDTASREGLATRRISNCLYAEAFDFLKMEDVEQLQARADGLRKEVVGEWEGRGDLVIEMSTLDILAFSPNAAPFSIFPFAARTCIELMIGSKFYITHLNLSAVAREFEHRGWTIEKRPENLSPEEVNELMMRVSKGGCHANVSPGDFMRLQVETLRPKTLIQSFDTIYDRGPGWDGYLLSLFSGESEIWD